MQLFIILLLFLGIFDGVESYKIGILTPDVSGSQLMFNQRIAETLVDAGHNVTLIRLQTMDMTDVKSKTRKDIIEWFVDGILEDFDYEKLKAKQGEEAFSDSSIWSFVFDKEKKEFFANATEGFLKSCNKIIRNEKFIKKLQESKFDVMFSHMYNFCPIGIVHLSKTPTWIWLNSGTLMDYVAYYMGLSFPASYSAPMMADVGDHLTFGQRMKSVIGHTLTPILTRRMFAVPETELFRKVFGNDFPDLIEIAKTAPLVLVNSNELYDLPRPTLSKIVNIGGLGMRPEQTKPLPKQVQEKVDKADSVVVFTFGSVANISRMPLEWKKAFLSAFSKFPKTQFFMRYSTDDLGDLKPSNVESMKWIPQVDLLHHSKTKILITHGGYNSLQEALNSAIPILAIPLFGDQFRNGHIIEKHHLGLKLAKSEISEESIFNALKVLLEDEKYKKAIVRMRRMIQKQPVSSEQNLIKWTEFLAEFQNLDNLRPVGAKLDGITFWNVDVYLTFVAIIFAILVVIFLMTRWILRRICNILEFYKTKKDKKE